MGKSKTVAYIQYLPVRMAVAVVDALPVGFALASGRWIGRVMWIFLPRRRNLAIGNVLLAGITADADTARGIAKESFESFGMLTVESLIATRLLTPETLDQHIVMEVPPATAALLDDPARGGIFVSAHIGNWEVGGHVISFWKRLVAVARTLNNPYVQRLMERRNPRQNMEIVAKHSRDRMSLIRPLKNGMMLGLISDQHSASHAVTADFFGLPARTVTSPARLHLSTGCPIVCGFCARVGEMKFRMVASEPLFYENTGDRDADILRITTDLNKRLEEIIRQYPGQYLWAHRRWRGAAAASPKNVDASAVKHEEVTK